MKVDKYAAYFLFKVVYQAISFKLVTALESENTYGSPLPESRLI